jgi:hypothetical protein
VTAANGGSNFFIAAGGIQSQVVAPGGACTTGGANAWVQVGSNTGFLSAWQLVDTWTVYVDIN